MSFTAKDILKIEVAPALGCTEPVAIALGAAAAASVLKSKTFDKIEILVDPNIYKNGLAVCIPGAGGLSGLDLAAALGALDGDPELKMEVLDPITENSLERAKALVEEGRVKVGYLEEPGGIYIKSVITSGSDTAETVIRDLHDNIVSIFLNGSEIKKSSLLKSRAGNGGKDLENLEEWLKSLSMKQLLELVDQFDEEDLDFIRQGLSLNMKLAEYGLKYAPGLSIGKTLERLVIQKLIKKDMILAARILTSAAADARMSGVKLPAMSSAGSGNHGLTAILPIRAVMDYIKSDENEMLKAIGLSHIITACVKAQTGRLSAVCGCSIAAGAGAAAGVAYLMGGNLAQISGAIKNIIVDLAGVICDGAKAGCALKLATAAGTAVQSALFALQGITVMDTDGIVGSSPEKTMENVGTLATLGMIETDRTILKIMLEKKFS
jgi:L-cysteine desulfidase